MRDWTAVRPHDIVPFHYRLWSMGVLFLFFSWTGCPSTVEGLISTSAAPMDMIHDTGRSSCMLVHPSVVQYADRGNKQPAGGGVLGAWLMVIMLLFLFRASGQFERYLTGLLYYASRLLYTNNPL
ncbi:hypothetical protein QBC45DRAFT_176673 [Copromyces sp. CBS 386.78]|nr:hypothetical protein QBC45DRAFT_176673 [Copromyces sp. CBS 386.78]